ncbi:hypothetical protein K503DRAFT_805338 [Rhizopogon vinicolor AM-OR11-026]|uniref:Uncharacterized protein n=1 Tax=Rhizopogon vinicolor AM-OR11-026 TaxID=1314800 RepID=A0A1B7MI79_9AGAM|nr:hypothetical protein K503DRAFT_805338 [Rhizopogon vinicolor AM-OR11-026]
MTVTITRTMFGKETTSDDTLEALESLERGHSCLMDKVETLYMSLNLHDRFPELKEVDLNFVCILLMAHDLKINICKQAIASFFEWDKLDHAVGGAQQALGTKLHQQMHKAIAKHQPALMTAIRKFNSYCEQLESSYDPSCGIPLPSALPTKLTELRGDPTLMEDVWIAPSVGDVPRWLEDSDIRLGIEADNLCCFFGEELATMELAICLPESEPFMVALEMHQSNFLQTQTRWANSLASLVQFASHVKEAIATATTIAGGSQSITFHWINTTTTLVVPKFDGEGEVAVFSDLDDVAPQVDAEQAMLADVLESEMGTIDDNEDLTDFSCDIHATIVWEVPENLLLDDFCVPLRGQSLIIPGTIVT